MSGFSPDQLEALRDLQDVWGRDGIVLIGASALGQHLDMRWRQTADLDLTISTSTNDVVDSMKGLNGWRRAEREPHRWLSPKGVKVDVIPAGPALVAAGNITWPETGAVMSLVGFRLVFETSTKREIAPGHEMRVASLPAIAMLKMAAYLDRPSERARDLEDLGYIVDNYCYDNDERRYSQPVVDAGVQYEQAGAFLLGQDLASLVDGRERDLIKRFLTKLRDTNDGAGTLSRFARLAPPSWHKEEEEVLKRLQAFEMGLA
jgi:predicted nucleotidyltransferase